MSVLFGSCHSFNTRVTNFSPALVFADRQSGRILLRQNAVNFTMHFQESLRCTGNLANTEKKTALFCLKQNHINCNFFPQKQRKRELYLIYNKGKETIRVATTNIQRKLIF